MSKSLEYIEEVSDRYDGYTRELLERIASSSFEHTGRVKEDQGKDIHPFMKEREEYDSFLDVLASHTFNDVMIEHRIGFGDFSPVDTCRSRRLCEHTDFSVNHRGVTYTSVSPAITRDQEELEHFIQELEAIDRALYRNALEHEYADIEAELKENLGEDTYAEKFYNYACKTLKDFRNSL